MNPPDSPFLRVKDDTRSRPVPSRRTEGSRHAAGSPGGMDGRASPQRSCTRTTFEEPVA
jgi:hypothetical protein